MIGKSIEVEQKDINKWIENSEKIENNEQKISLE